MSCRTAVTDPDGAPIQRQAVSSHERSPRADTAPRSATRRRAGSSSSSTCGTRCSRSRCAEVQEIIRMPAVVRMPMAPSAGRSRQPARDRAAGDQPAQRVRLRRRRRMTTPPAWWCINRGRPLGLRGRSDGQCGDRRGAGHRADGGHPTHRPYRSAAGHDQGATARHDHDPRRGQPGRRRRAGRRPTARRGSGAEMGPPPARGEAEDQRREPTSCSSSASRWRARNTPSRSRRCRRSCSCREHVTEVPNTRIRMFSG